MKWQDLDAGQRYEMLQMIRLGKTTVPHLAETLSVTKATLYEALKAAEEAAKAALVPGRPGRKPRPEAEVQVSDLLEEKAKLEKLVQEWQTKYEVAKTLLDFERLVDSGGALPGEKKRRRRRKAAG
jgi:hypothetical protein